MAAGALDPPARKKIVHPKPTGTVIKELYGTAFRCGKPDCKRPLYRVNDETGETVLNSQVAHIHARSEGGPRWKDGMSADENRSAPNLIPLCLEHAFEIDQTPDVFPADLLREWKAAQLAECRQLQKSWTLTDDEADEVRSRSFDAREHGHATASAQLVMQAMSEVGLLIEVAPTVRRIPAAVAAEWRRKQAEANAGTYIYGPDGERVHIELSYGERRELRVRMQEALAEAAGRLEPRVVAINGMARALSADTSLAPWCDWLRSATAAVLAAMLRWPDGESDDSALSDALEGLHRASMALGRTARGEQAETPPHPEPEPAPPEESDVQRQIRLHKETLEAARPWARVDHRPFDGAVYDSLADAASFALGLPPIPSLLASDLDTCARLASAVARNADDDVLRVLIDRAGGSEPVAVAAAFLRNLAQTAGKTFHEAEQNHAGTLLRSRLEAATWDSEADWQSNGMYCREVLHWTAHVVGSDHVRGRLAAALDARPSLVREMLLGIAQHGESRDFETGALLGITSDIRDVPQWLPTDEVVVASGSQMPDVVARDVDPIGDPTPNLLAAQLLWRLQSRPQPA